MVDSFSTVISEGVDGDIHAVTDLDPHTWGEMNGNGYIQWTVENLEGSKWNSFNILGSTKVNSMDFTIQTIFDPDDSLIAPLTTQFQGQTITDRVKPQFSVPVGMAGFRRVHWEITGAAT